MKETMSKLLSLFELRGQTWCYVDIKHPGGFRVPLNTDVLFYALLQGNARLVGLSSIPLELRAGDVIMILSGKAHTIEDQPGSPVQTLEFLAEERHVDMPPTVSIGDRGSVVGRLLCGRMTIDWPRAIPRGALPPVLDLDAQDPATSMLRVDALQSAGAGPGSAALLTRLASLMFAAGLRKHPQSLLPRSPEKDSIAQALRLIAADPAAPWTVARLARKVGMGRSTFAARFTAEVGRAPMELVIEQRMQYAARLLRDGDLKVAEIGTRVGYSSEGSFSRRFTQHFGVSPSQMRRVAEGRKHQPQNSPWVALLAGGKTAPGPESAPMRTHRPLGVSRS
jgi:AraC-like DNA-binding protein